jgi:uncharacterized membrane protein
VHLSFCNFTKNSRDRTLAFGIEVVSFVVKGNGMSLLCAFVLGFIAGQRSMLAPAFAAWAAHLGIVNVAATPLAFMGYHYTYMIFTVLALGELVADKLPSTPSRKAPGPFGARIVSGALVGATIGAAAHSIVFGALAGIIGAIIGTLGGAAIRARLAVLFRRDLPAALLEDAVALALGFLCMAGLR